MLSLACVHTTTKWKKPEVKRWGLFASVNPQRSPAADQPLGTNQKPAFLPWHWYTVVRAASASSNRSVGSVTVWSCASYQWFSKSNVCLSNSFFLQQFAYFSIWFEYRCDMCASSSWCFNSLSCQPLPQLHLSLPHSLFPPLRTLPSSLHPSLTLSLPRPLL